MPENKKPKTSNVNSNEFGDCIFVDVEENKTPVGHPEPMFLEESDATQIEINEMVSIYLYLVIYSVYVAQLSFFF